jgi:hypothetical protein
MEWFILSRCSDRSIPITESKRVPLARLCIVNIYSRSSRPNNLQVLSASADLMQVTSAWPRTIRHRQSYRSAIIDRFNSLSFLYLVGCRIKPASTLKTRRQSLWTCTRVKQISQASACFSRQHMPKHVAFVPQPLLLVASVLASHAAIWLALALAIPAPTWVAQLLNVLVPH